ncbi:MAG TPA: DNA repair protein RecN [Solirubrobacteraceae bacterium]|nr:DNA repair protein RecN [Solirubrobacteraceae bacterium]
MLCELRVENLLLIERAELRLAPGLNVLTGETGAGKTVLAHALDLLLGGRARSGIVRPGAEDAYVEGVFDDDGRDVVLARRVTREGRTRAYVDHRSATVTELAARAAGLLRFYGQHEHHKLTLASSQLEVLDAFCGDAHRARLTETASAHARVREAEEQLGALQERAGNRDRELDLLAFELREIDDAALSAGERAELVARRELLRHAELLRGATLGAAEALAPEDGETGAALLAGSAISALDAAAGIDAELDALAVRVRSLAYEAQDIAAELRAHGERAEAQPGELDAVEERLGVYDRLERKHGGDLAAVLAHAAECRARHEELADGEIALATATEALEAARTDRTALAKRLHDRRSAVSGKLAEAVCDRLEGLAMEGATFEVVLSPSEPGPSGADVVEFRIAPNAGVGAGPLREIASGGELSRVMLALMGIANAGDGTTLVFDEVDAGIGGQTARVVGERLRELAEDRQVVCITHLPQIASLAARHFSITKDTHTDPVRTTVVELGGKAVVGELVRMLGADGADDAARRHAEELLRAA